MNERLARSSNHYNRLDFPSLLASTLPGAGKTRLCEEFVSRIAPAVFNSRGLEFISLFVTFSNATSFDITKDWTIVFHADPEHALATRLLQAYFDIPPTFFEVNFAQTGSFRVDATLEFIQQFEFKRRHGRAPKPGDQLPYVAIAVDEINRLLALSAEEMEAVAAVKEPAAVKRANAARKADVKDKVGAQEKLVSEANPVPQVLSASEASVVQAHLARQRYLEKLKSQRWLLKHSLWSLKNATVDPASRLFVLYAGTLPEHLTPGLVEHIVPENSSNLEINPVPMEPFDGPHTAEFADVVASISKKSVAWRLNASLVGQLRIAGGLPGHIEAAMSGRTESAIATPEISAVSLIELVHFCAFDTVMVSQLDRKVAAWVSRGAAFVAATPSIATLSDPDDVTLDQDDVALDQDDMTPDQDDVTLDQIFDQNAPKLSLQFNLYKEVKLIPIDFDLEPVKHSLDVILRLADTLKESLKCISKDLANPLSKPDLWERLVVHLFNLRVTAYLAHHVLSASKPSSSAVLVPLSKLLPGVKFSDDCKNLSLKLKPKKWGTKVFMQLAPENEPGIDAYMLAKLAGHATKKRVVIGLQMKLHMHLQSTGPAELRKYENSARQHLDQHYVQTQYKDDTLVLVGVMSTARLATAKPAENSWALERSALNKFAQGFQTAMQSAYSFDPHHSPASHIASSFYSWGTRTQEVCNALAHLLVQTRHLAHQRDSLQQFKTAGDLRQFLFDQIGDSKEVSFTLTERGETKQVTHTLTKGDVPPVKHLGWYFALPDTARSAASSSSASMSS
ncbi:hypothetical protein CAOG_009998 [Capsaspora owczarzaki ATCC 30864]|uniref:Uncharacterized protein n=1 Tax=Capsaspora owczarzaki (strain ATCC 30864) TaxID=595528 RepID=A0A0D2UM71_CAPO3|nr:hypothetical protein CAOG_009998 [Capsaspora owczarzaki ATCC 30864]